MRLSPVVGARVVFCFAGGSSTSVAVALATVLSNCSAASVDAGVIAATADAVGAGMTVVGGFFSGAAAAAAFGGGAAALAGASSGGASTPSAKL